MFCLPTAKWVQTLILKPVASVAITFPSNLTLGTLLRISISKLPILNKVLLCTDVGYNQPSIWKFPVPNPKSVCPATFKLWLEAVCLKLPLPYFLVVPSIVVPVAVTFLVGLVVGKANAPILPSNTIKLLPASTVSIVPSANFVAPSLS